MENTYSFSEKVRNSVKLSKDQKARLVKVSRYVKSIRKDGIVSFNSDYAGSSDEAVVYIGVDGSVIPNV